MDNEDENDEDSAAARPRLQSCHWAVPITNWPRWINVTILMNDRHHLIVIIIPSIIEMMTIMIRDVPIPILFCQL